MGKSTGIKFLRIELIFVYLFITSVNVSAQQINNLGRYKYQPGDWVTYQNCNYVTSLTESPEYIYFGTSGGVVPFHKIRKQWEIPYTVSDGLNGNWIYAVLYDRDRDQLWASTEKGLCVLRPAEAYWEGHALSEYNLPVETPIEMLGKTSNYIYCKAGQGIVFRIDDNLGFFATYDTEPDINWMPNVYLPLPELPDYFINEGFLWDPDGEIRDSEHRSYPISVYYVDKSQDVYGGTWGVGIFNGDEGLRRLDLIRIGPIQNNIRALTIADDRLWMGGTPGINGFRTYDQGISVFDLNTAEWNYFESRFIHELETDEILCMDNVKNQIWIGTSEGLSIYDNNKRRWSRIDFLKGLVDNYISAIAFDGEYVWIGTPKGLSRVFPDDRTATTVFLSQPGFYNSIYDIAVNQGTIWFATNNGLFSLRKNTGEISHYDGFGVSIPVNKPTPSTISTVAVDDSVVIAVYRDQLLILKGSGWKIRKIPEISDYFACYDSAIDGGKIWLASSTGLYMYQLNREMWYNFKTEDGLPSNNVQALLSDQDGIWIGSDAGLTKFHWSNYVSSN